MLPDSGLLFWMTIIFAIVFFVLAKFGFPIITGMVEKRENRINNAIAAAKKAEESLSHLNEQQERIIAETRAEHARILQEAASMRDSMIAQAKETAQQEAQKIMEEAKKRIEEEKESALRDVRREVAVFSVNVAEKILRRQLSDDSEQKEFIARMMEEVSASQKAES